MDPTTIDEFLLKRPIPPLRLTLSSGDQIVVTADDAPYLEGLSLVLRGRNRIQSGPRLVSLPNIALIEPLDPHVYRGRRRS